MSGFPTTVARLAFEPGGRWMACDGGAAVAFWDFSGAGPTGREAVLGEGYDDAVTALGWSGDDSRTLLTGDATGTVATWRLGRATRPGDRIRPIASRATGDPVTALAVASGQVLAGHHSGALSCGPVP
ncbi:hypothetical protein [Pseudonocardia nigra]|uniref:hypothetical protein n=1 Tax=Pseudonocardia nigra TaxID=1921578 RepID=UPI001C5CD2A3|nr:hypothetical protein [Pseudonocardia nigra]